MRILTEPQNALMRQYQALLATEGIKLEFSRRGVAEIARFAMEVNQATENIGARRLATILETRPRGPLVRGARTAAAPLVRFEADEVARKAAPTGAGPGPEPVHPLRRRPGRAPAGGAPRRLRQARGPAAPAAIVPQPVTELRLASAATSSSDVRAPRARPPTAAASGCWRSSSSATEQAGVRAAARRSCGARPPESPIVRERPVAARGRDAVPPARAPVRGRVGPRRSSLSPCASLRGSRSTQPLEMRRPGSCCAGLSPEPAPATSHPGADPNPGPDSNPGTAPTRRLQARPTPNRTSPSPTPWTKPRRRRRPAAGHPPTGQPSGLLRVPRRPVPVR